MLANIFGPSQQNMCHEALSAASPSVLAGTDVKTEDYELCQQKSVAHYILTRMTCLRCNVLFQWFSRSEIWFHSNKYCVNVWPIRLTLQVVASCVFHQTHIKKRCIWNSMQIVICSFGCFVLLCSFYMMFDRCCGYSERPMHQVWSSVKTAYWQNKSGVSSKTRWKKYS